MSLFLWVNILAPFLKFFSLLAEPHGVQNFPNQGSNLHALKWNLSLNHWTAR